MTVEVQQMAAQIEKLREENLALKQLLRGAREAIGQLTRLLEDMANATKEAAKETKQ